jgi:Ran GTPase-activating protein (RanGAP) involved in mRNA processing and transport
MLEELDLGANLIGRAENLNTVMPELITGGEALAALIASNTCHISMLHLSWNMIRLDGAIEFASSLSHNKFLRYLDISYNSLGIAGGEMLGMALLSNHCLRTLLISNNNINSTACFTICVGIEENYSLEYVNMDSNPIGVMGAKILMQIPVTSGSRVRVSAAK